MSYYYNYYIGYFHNNKIYPLGPYDSFNKIQSVISRSGSFASDLYKSFRRIPEESITDELCRNFSYPDYDGNECFMDVKYLFVDDLPKDSYIKKGYYLISEVAEFENNHCECEPDFTKPVSPLIYSAMSDNEKIYGKPKPYNNEYEELIIPKSASDYMYYFYEDYSSKEYESFILRSLAYILGDYNSNIPKDSRIVILETEG